MSSRVPSRHSVSEVEFRALCDGLGPIWKPGLEQHGSDRRLRAWTDNRSKLKWQFGNRAPHLLCSTDLQTFSVVLQCWPEPSGFRPTANHLAAGILMKLLLVVFPCFCDVGLVAGFGHSLHKRVSACGS